MIRRLLSASAALLLLMVSGAGTAAAQTAETDAAVGTAENLVELVSLSLDGLPLDLGDLTIGSLQSFASTDDDTVRNLLGGGDPFALAEILLVAGQGAVVTSDGPTSTPGQSAALPAGSGTVTLGAMEAVAAATDARSTISVLSGEVNTVLAQLTAAIPANGVDATVDDDAATALNGAALRDLSIGLGDLLPADLLSLLPLETLLALLDGLPVGDLGELDAVVGQLEGVIGDLEDLSALEGQVAGIVGQLEAAAAPLDDVLAAGGVVDTALVNDVVADLTAIEDGPLAALTDQLDALLPGLLDSITDLLALDLDGLLDDLLGGLDALELIGLDEILVGVEAVASADSSAGTIACTVSGLRVLGQAVDGVVDCDQLTAQLDFVRALLLDVLANLPVVGGLTGGAVTVEGITTSTSAADATEGDYHVASAVVEGLDVGIASLDLADITGSLVDDLLGLLDGLLGGGLDGLLGGDLTGLLGDPSSLLGDLLDGGLDGLVGGLQMLVAGLVDLGGGGGGGDLTGPVTDLIGDVGGIVGGGGAGLLNARALPDGVTADGVLGALGGLEGLLGGLPTGDLLGGVATPGLSLSALDVVSTASFASTSVPAPPGTPQVPTSPGTPQTPTPSTALPRTGGGVALALLTLGTGAGATVWLRRRGGGGSAIV